jgi:hypothetical protein
LVFTGLFGTAAIIGQNFIAELRAVALNLQLNATASKGDLACSGNHCGRVLRPGAVKLALQL